MVAVEVLETHDAVHAMRSDWDALCDVSRAATPFQRPDWILAWLAHVGGEPLRVLALRCGRDLVGLVPAFLRGAPSAWTVSLLGAGIADRLDVLAAPGFERATLDAMHEWLTRHDADWKACAFDELGPAAWLRELRPPSGARATIEPQSVCPVLAFGEAQSFEEIVPRPQRARVRKARDRALQLGQVEQVRADRGDDLEQTLRALFALHARRWELRREPGVLGDARVRRLHEDVARTFAARGALRLYALRIGGRPACIVHGFREKQRLYLCLQAVDPALERVSPGVLAVGFAIADALVEGAREIDFLRGGDAYKYAWGAMDEANARYCIER